MEAAEAALANGEICAEISILVGPTGGIQMFTHSDWALDALAHHHGAAAAYRVKERGGTVQVQARSGSRTCLMESIGPREIARRLLR